MREYDIVKIKERRGKEKHKLIANLQKIPNYRKLKEIAVKMNVPLVKLAMEILNDEMKKYHLNEMFSEADFFSKIRIMTVLKDKKLIEIISDAVDNFISIQK